MAQATSLSPGRKYIPFYQQASTLLQLRAENTFAFERVQLSVAEHVVLLDDVQTDKLAAAGVGIALVDLNRLDAIFGNARVVSILDHHQDEGLYPDVKPRLVKVPVGSCASLVTIFFREHLELLPAELAELLLSCVHPNPP
jgi:exopolyphosphatase